MAQVENMVDCFSGLYKGKRVLVTGHSGFKGSWMTLWLKELGADVAGFSLNGPSVPFMFEALRLKDTVKNYDGDIRDLNQVKKVFEDFKPQVVFHLAAQPIVRKSYDDPVSTFEININGTINVLEAIRVVGGVEAVVVVSSDKCYENVNKADGYIEGEPLGGFDPYSASKGCVEIVAHSYCRSFFKKEDAPKLATVRAGNVIGGGDWADDRIIPDCVRAWQDKKEVVVRKPEATRPWQHVLEPLCGYMTVGARLISKHDGVHSEAFNFGPCDDSNRSVRDLVEVLFKSFPGAVWKHVPMEGDKKEANLLHLNCAKADRVLGWRPALNFEETVSMTAQWYQDYYRDSSKISAFTLKQIQMFIKKFNEHSQLQF